MYFGCCFMNNLRGMSVLCFYRNLVALFSNSQGLMVRNVYGKNGKPFGIDGGSFQS